MSMSRTMAIDPPVVAKAARRAAAKTRVEARRKTGVAPLLTAVVVVLLVVAAVSFSRSSGLVAALWGAGGVAAGVWLRTSASRNYDIAFGALIATGFAAGNILVGNTLAQTILFTLANTSEVLAAVFLTRMLVPSLSTDSVGAVARLCAIGLTAPLVGAGFAYAGIQMIGLGDPLLGAQTWWFGHALGMCILTPFILAVGRGRWSQVWTSRRAIEGAVLFAALVGIVWYGYFFNPGKLGFFALPLMALLTARARISGVAAGGVVLVVGTIVARSLHPAPDVPLAEQIMLLQLNLLAVLLPFLFLSAMLAERDGLAERARLAQVRAERASEAKSRLLANVAHEIKSPVGGMIGIGDLWRSGQLGATTPTQLEMAEMLVKTGRQVETLAHDLLDVAQAEAGAVKVELRPTDVLGLLEDVRRATALRPDAKGVRLELIREDACVVAQADSQRLSQVLTNFASNAVKYGAAGGVVTFRAFHSGARIRIEVADKGAGLSREKQAQLFEPFNRLGLERSTVEGHGIGLALARRLIELQDGQIGVDSTPGEGATFWVELPSV